MNIFILSRLQLEKVLTEKEAQVELQASEITASEERMGHLQTQLQQTEVELSPITDREEWYGGGMSREWRWL